LSGYVPPPPSVEIPVDEIEGATIVSWDSVIWSLDSYGAGASPQKSYDLGHFAPRVAPTRANRKIPVS